MHSHKIFSKVVWLPVLTVCFLALFDSPAFCKAKTNPAASREKMLAKRSSKVARAHGPEFTVPEKKLIRLRKEVIPEKPVRDAVEQVGTTYLEVEVRVDKQFTLDYLKGLPTAPASAPKVLEKPTRAVLQLPAEQVAALIKKGADIRIIRKFILVDGSTELAAGGSKPNPKTNTKDLDCYGENQDWVYIPDYDGWVYSAIPISCAPGATVTSIDVHYEISHTYVSDLVVDLTDEDGDYGCPYRLFEHDHGGSYLDETVYGLTVCNGRPVNQWWYLWALDEVPGDDGYITYWWIKVYYEGGCTPPANDECGNAIAVSKDVPYFGSTDCATGTDVTSCGDNDWADVWHSFTPASTGEYTVSLCGSSFDTTLAVFDNCGGTELVCNDDFCGLQSEVEVPLTAGHTYLIRVSGYNGATGDYTLLVTGSGNNDECENAIAVSANVPYNGSSVGATGTDITSCGNDDTADVWHSFTPATSGDYSISLCGSAFDTVLAVFDDCGGTELACNDNSCGLQSALEVALTAGQEYLIRVSGNNGATGNYTLLVTKTGDGVTNYYAVICGISDYLYASDLTYCDDDAWDVRDALLAWGNWDNANITMLIDSAATKNAIHTAILNMGSIADEDDICLFYFSGHGSNYTEFEAPYDESDGLDEYLITHDTEYIDDAISDDEFGDWIGGLPTNKCIVLLDACFSGGQIKGLGATGETLTAKGIGSIVPQKGDGFAADLIKTMRTKDLDDYCPGVVLTACDDDEECYESPSLQNSIFTYYLVEGMLGPADSEGDGDGLISAEECYVYTYQRALNDEPTQHAQILDCYPGELDFLTNEITVQLDLSSLWTYQSLPGQTNSRITAEVNEAEFDDPAGNSGYTYYWEFELPGDVTVEPVTVSGGGTGDESWTFAAPNCNETGGISDSGQVFKVRVQVVGNDYGNSGTAEREFAIALLGDVNNDTSVEGDDRAICNTFWRTGTAESYTLKDCDLNCDGLVNGIDRSIANSIWRGLAGSNSIGSPCPLR